MQMIYKLPNIKIVNNNIDIVIDYKMKNISTDNNILSKYPFLIQELAKKLTITSSAIVFHYLLNSPKDEKNPIALYFANLIINTIIEYIPKSIIENHSIPSDSVKKYMSKILIAVDKYFTDIKIIIKSNRKIDIDKIIYYFKNSKHDSIYYKINDKNNLFDNKKNKLFTFLQHKFDRYSESNNKIMLFIKSFINNALPLFVKSLDIYFTPYTLSLIINRIIIVLTDIINNNIHSNIKKKYKSCNTIDKELIKQFGTSINNICKTALSCLKLSLTSSVLAGTAKIGLSAFTNMIGTTIFYALESTTENDLERITFLFNIFFKECNIPSNIDNIYDYVINLDKTIEQIDDDNIKKNLTSNFYNNMPSLITNIIKSVNVFASNASREIINSLTDFFRLTLENQELLDIMVYDYILPTVLLE